jgi:hypothetical protein
MLAEMAGSREHLRQDCRVISARTSRMSDWTGSVQSAGGRELMQVSRCGVIRLEFEIRPPNQQETVKGIRRLEVDVRWMSIE